jgi:Ca2+-binding RTX toxin-like protein
VLLNNSNPTATLTIASNDAPVLSAPTTINYIDTIFDDSFATVTGVLVASDIDGDSLTYGIAGGADNGDGTISKSNDYGKLIVNKITADYSFIPNKAGIERLTLVENSNFTVTVSDGRFSDSQALSINIERVGSDSSDRLTGTAGDDVLNGLAGNDTIYALAGDDRINGGEGADKMLGGKGDDTYYVDNVDDKVIEHKGEGVDTVHSTARSFTLPANVENLFIDSFSYVGSGMTGIGNSLDNYMTSGYSNNTIYGLAGNDSLYGHTAKSGQNILVGGTGDDSYYVGGYVDANDIIIENKNEGEDTVYATASCTLSDNVENLVLVGDRTDRGIFRGTGNELNNHLTGSGTQSVLEGLGGNDNYYVGNEGTVIVESANNGWDTVLSTTNRTLEANVEELYLLGTANLYGRGNEQDNNLNGNVGNNMLDGRGGADFMQGGAGDDTYYVDNAGDVVKERAGEGLDTVNSRVSYTLSANVENLTINLERAASPILVGTGNELDNHLKADGRIEISAHAILEGMAGNDTLDSNIRCSSIMLGGEGNDFYYIYNVGDTVTEYANQGIDTVNSGLDSYTLTANVENLILGPIPFIGISASSGTGNELANRLTGNRANNTLDGKAGDDILVGGDGADLLIGGLGKDSYDLNETTVATDTVRIAKGDSLVSTYDMATGFQLGMSALDNLGVDKLDLDSSKIAANANAVDGKNSGNIKSHHISDGIISFDDVNHYVNPLAITQTDLSNVFSYLQANITNNDTVAFVSQGNTFVFQDGGTTDTLVELVGVVAHSIDTSGLAAGAVWIV